MKRQADIDDLFRRYYKPMCLYALHYLDNHDEVEDVVQESFVSLWNKIQAGEAPENSAAYLAACVRNRCIDKLRKQRALNQVPMPREAAETISDTEALDRSADEAILWEAIDALPPGRRQMLLMHRREGLKYTEIAVRLGVSEGTVRNQISRALKTLREIKREKS